MQLFIKNMVCGRCKMVVKSEFEKLGFHPISIELGVVEIRETNIDSSMEVLLQNLRSWGFDLIDDKQSKIIEHIKTLIVELVHYQINEPKINLSEYLTQNILHDYSTLSNLFSEVEGTTIEKYFISLKIEKVKELLMYDELTLSEISYKLNYSSVAYLSNQFKKVTGFTTSYYKNLKDKKRRQIEDL